VRDGLGTRDTVAVFGGASDIGLATARALVRRGTRAVALAARKPDRLEGASAMLASAGASAVHLLDFDADAVEDHEAVVADVADRLGDIDVAVLTFGILGDQRAAERDAAAALEIARTNYLDAVSLLLALAARMIEQGHGDIVVLSSVAAERARRSNFVYGSSKAGLDTFAQGLDERLRGTGVRVLIVRPGFVRSKMTQGLKAAPLATTPAAVARAIDDALAGRARVVWVPPALRWVMIILRHLPTSVFRRLRL
jgi:decaprenylphospho-beta-D-erythro-pentofuranosid-2-ulose 2-reductase